MRVAISISPGTVMLIRNVLGYHSLPHIFKISQKTWLKFDGGDSGCGASNDMVTVPLLMPELLTSLATSEVMSIMSQLPLVLS